MFTNRVPRAHVTLFLRNRKMNLVPRAYVTLSLPLPQDKLRVMWALGTRLSVYGFQLTLTVFVFHTQQRVLPKLRRENI